MVRHVPDTIALVLHFRDSARTLRCLASLVRERIARVMLVDNSDDGGASLGSLLASAAESCPGLAIDVLDPGTNLGFSAGVNRGLERVRELHGEACVLLLNSDADLRPGAHEAMRDGIRGGLGLASAWMIGKDGSRLGWAYYQPFAAILSVHAWPGAFRYQSACCMLLAPELAARPLLDECFFFYGEDIELGWRLSRAGIAHGVVDGAVVDHEGSAASRNGSLFYEYHMARAHLLLPGRLAKSALARLAMHVVRWISLPLRSLVRSVRLRSMAPWRGLLFAWADVVAGRARSLVPPLAL
jgi:GT2 family glycosyltransferase